MGPGGGESRETTQCALHQGTHASGTCGDGHTAAWSPRVRLMLPTVVPQLDTVQLDSSHGSMLLDADMQLRRYRGLLDRLRTLALPVEESRDFIRRIAQDL
ncbi:Scr1 family TA system antitoxin-like transcriptional regulator [Streptomyces sp. ADI92-24]|uniref:Scr1 family TA system antitoxin-like transcriptional regulator n=2 Tax=Streptomyces TaxID=1883 RepID=UPI003216AEC7